MKIELKGFNIKKKLLVQVMLPCMLLAFQGAFSQPGTNDSGGLANNIGSDTLIPSLVNKVASYTFTIDRNTFLIRRKFNMTPISADLPGIEKSVKGFKSRLEKKGRQMNLRSLNSGVILLQEVANKLAAYQTILFRYSSQLTKSNAEVKKIIHDPALNLHIPDSTIYEQLQDLKEEGISLDSLQVATLSHVNLLYNRVSVNLLQAKDIISDMSYLSASLKIAMWSQDESPLLEARPDEYHQSLWQVTLTALQRSRKIIYIYLNGKWNVFTLSLLVFVFITGWCIMNMRRLNKMDNNAGILEPVHFLSRGTLVGCVMGYFTYSPLFYANPTMSFLHANEFLRLLALSFLIMPFLKRQAKILWILASLLWLYYALDDILLESAFGERWGLFVAGILFAGLCIRIIVYKGGNFTRISESPATKSLAIFALAQVVMSIIFNLSGHLALAKIFGVSAIQCLVLGITLKVFCTMVLEAIYLQSEAYQQSRFSDFINFNLLQHRYRKILWILACLVWFISLIRNLTFYDVMTQAVGYFFTQQRAIGNMTFTFQSVAVFIVIIWFSSVISKFINFFFGNESSVYSDKRSGLGSMMLLIRLTIWSLGFLIAVAASGIPLDRLSLMIGALGVGIGFGLQNIVNNLVSGVILAFERPIQVGDQIEIGNKSGIVKEIGVRSSKIKSSEGSDIIVPNGDLLSQHLINWTMQDRSKRVEFMITVPYEADIRHVKTLIMETLKLNDSIMQIPEPVIMVQEFTEQAIHVRILFWVPELSQAGMSRSNAMVEIYEALAKSGEPMSYHKN